MKLTPYTIAASLLLSTSMVLNGAHAKEVFAMQVAADSAQKQELTTSAKIGADLHTHVDKHFGKVGVDNPQVDSRSLRLRETKKLPINTAIRGWLNSWRDQLAMYLD